MAAQGKAPRKGTDWNPRPRRPGQARDDGVPIGAREAPVIPPEAGDLWNDRARRVTEHALYHMQDYEVIAELELAVACMKAATGEAAPPDLDDDVPYPGDDEYECVYDVYAQYGCPYEPWE